MKMSNLIALLAMLFLVIVIFLSFIDTKEEFHPNVDFGTVEVYTEVADTRQEQITGLSGREELPENDGLLFVYDTEVNRYFWMKDMNFCIDIIWMDSNQRVIDITEDLCPDTYPEKFTSSLPTKYVLEVNSGFSKQNQIKVGDIAEITL